MIQKAFCCAVGSCSAGCAAVLALALVWSPPVHAQIYLVKDINPSGSSGVIRIGASGSVVYFSADDGTHGEELWRSDGTAAGTYLVKDVWPDSQPDATDAYSSKPEQFTVGGGFVHFAASGRQDPITFNGDFELWKTDGTDGGTSSHDIWSGTIASSPSWLVTMGGSLYLSAYDETYGNEVFKVTAGSVALLKDIEVTGNSNPRHLAVVHLAGPDDERLLFSAYTTADGFEIWISDGSADGTSMVKNINPTTGAGSAPSHITGFGGKAYFSADDGTNGDELWVTDGTEGGTSLLKDIDPSGSSSPHGFTAVGGLLFFLADDGTHGTELWKTDGTADGTVMVKDLAPDGESSAIQSLTNFGGTLFFANSTTASGAELWSSDGTGDGTAMLKDINTGSANGLPAWSDPPELVVANGMLFFAANDGPHGSELWASDGSADGTRIVQDVSAGANWEGPRGLTVAGNLLFFQTDSSSGRELHAVNTIDIVTMPDTPTGMASGNTETAYTYTASGSVSLKGNPVQYRFNWGDGTDSGWLASGVTTADKTWSVANTYIVTVEARSSAAEAPTSAGLQVTMSFNEAISTPGLTGPSLGSTGFSYDFTVDGNSNYSHDLEYTVYWGDGVDDIDWTPFGSGIRSVDLSHAWGFAAEHTIQVGVRCASHTGLENWMDTTISISDGPSPGIFSDGFESGDTTGWSGLVP
jgi:ELWxxDGT repeat protein